jgi:hypothetical protein
VNIIKAVNAKHLTARKNIVNALKEVFPVIQINVNVKIAKMENVIMKLISNHKINKWFIIVHLIIMKLASKKSRSRLMNCLVMRNL